MSDNSYVLKKDLSRSLISKLAFLFLIILIGAALVSGVSILIWNSVGIDIEQVMNGDELTRNERIFFRIGLMVNHAGTFLLPAFLFFYLFAKEKVSDFLGINSNFRFAKLVLWGLVILFSYPLIGALAKWNMSLPIPDWLKSSQSESFALIEQTLQMSGISELFLSILLVGVFAALGEELIFRGIIQKCFEKSWSNGHLAVIISAIIFGGFHMQVERLIPLSFLGLILGYSYYFTGNILVPIMLHFLNNAIQVISIYVITRSGEMPEIDNIPDIPSGAIVASILLSSVFACIAIKQQTSNETRP